MEMHEHPLRATAVAHIAAAGRRTAADHGRLATALRSWCWPGGPADRTEPAGRGRMRQWGPACLDTVVLECTCAQGACTLCN
jgi:hypothetical protein